MFTSTSLQGYSQKDLAQMAKVRGLRGWHSMRKDELVKALVKAARSDKTRPHERAGGVRKKVAVAKSDARAAKTNGHAPRGSQSPPAVRKAKTPAVVRRIEAAHHERESRKDLARNGHANGAPARAAKRDRVVLMVRDPYWLHAHWELTRACVDRARAALAQQWHTARPVLRLYSVNSGATTTNSARVIRDIEIHGGVQNWYIDAPNPPQSFLVEIGYLAQDGRFHSIARSNVVTTPRPGSAGLTDENWADVAANCEKIYALSGGYTSETHTGDLQEFFEERLNRPMGSPMNTRYGMGAERFFGGAHDFELSVDAEIIIYGATKPDAHLMLNGEPIKLGPGGTFSVRMDLGNQRQVIPVVAESADGVQQRTIVIAIERNTKVMEPVMRDPNEF